MAPGTNSQEAHQRWAELYLRGDSAATLTYPSETLVRIFKGQYLPEFAGLDFAGKRVLDIGFGAGNNLAFLASLGLEIYGTEVDELLCQSTAAALQGLNRTAELRVGYNTDLPFPAEFFDILVSWSVLHYAESELDIERALKEYARVLKPAGILLVLTTGPGHLINKGSERLDDNRVRILREDDMRRGQVFWNFSSQDQIATIFQADFSALRQGRILDDLFGQIQDHWLIAAVK